MNSILMIFMFMIGCEVPAGILSYQYINFSPSKELYLPDCRMLEQEEAISKLSALDLDVNIVDLPYNSSYEPGTVTHMVPGPFTKIKTNRIITLSIAGNKKSIQVPNLKELSIRNAKIKIAELGFVLDTVYYDYSSTIDEGLVSDQIPEDGAILISGSPISIHVSRGHPTYYYTIPDLTNLPLKKAIEEIQSDGFRVGEITYVYEPHLIPNTVINQGFSVGLKVSVPVEIDLDVSKNKK